VAKVGDFLSKDNFGGGGNHLTLSPRGGKEKRDQGGEEEK